MNALAHAETAAMVGDILKTGLLWFAVLVWLYYAATLTVRFRPLVMFGLVFAVAVAGLGLMVNDIAVSLAQ